MSPAPISGVNISRSDKISALKAVTECKMHKIIFLDPSACRQHDQTLSEQMFIRLSYPYLLTPPHMR